MIELSAGKVNIVIDGQFGSTGKGLIAGYIGETCKIDLAITNAGPNSGHTYINRAGTKIVARHLPVSGIVNPCDMYLCPGSIIDPVTLREEGEKYGTNYFVDPRAAVVLPEDQEAEHDPKHSVTKIASTQKGTGEGLIAKIRRQRTFGTWAPMHGQDFDVRAARIDTRLLEGQTMLMEVPQGIHLGLNSGYWPFTTSREVSVSQALSDLCVHPSALGKVILSIRTYPIRVGNIQDENGDEIGFSGPFWAGSTETSWAELGQAEELTTVTKRVRRVATFSYHQLADAVRLCRPDYLFVNFMNYLKDYQRNDFLVKVRNVAPRAQLILGHGPSFHDVEFLG